MNICKINSLRISTTRVMLSKSKTINITKYNMTMISTENLLEAHYLSVNKIIFIIYINKLNN